jgi:hypothetical protein
MICRKGQKTPKKGKGQQKGGEEVSGSGQERENEGGRNKRPQKERKIRGQRRQE